MIREKRRPFTARLVLLTALVLMNCACVSMNGPAVVPQKKTAGLKTLNSMLELNDMNERAFAYHYHCLSKSEPMNEQFLKNFEVATNELFDECLKNQGMKPEYIVSTITKRREHIQQKLGVYYKTNGCDSPEAMAAKDHYRAFSLFGAKSP